MANAKKCDRCGAYYDEYNIARSREKVNGFFFVNFDSDNHYWLQSAVELCPTCKDKA